MSKTPINIIAAVNPDGVIGIANRLPWHYPSDLKRFQSRTRGSTVIMGRNTWLSLPRRPLLYRNNVVVTSTPISGVDTYPSLQEAIQNTRGVVWLIGGEKIFAEGLDIAQSIEITRVPDKIPLCQSHLVFFPKIDPKKWRLQKTEKAGLTTIEIYEKVRI